VVASASADIRHQTNEMIREAPQKNQLTILLHSTMVRRILGTKRPKPIGRETQFRLPYQQVAPQPMTRHGGSTANAPIRTAQGVINPL
jgi:hypothetical protein